MKVGFCYWFIEVTVYAMRGSKANKWRQSLSIYQSPNHSIAEVREGNKTNSLTPIQIIFSLYQLAGIGFNNAVVFVFFPLPGGSFSHSIILRSSECR